MTEPAPTYTPAPISSERAVKGRSNAPLCDYCGQEFEPEPENLGKQRFCNTECKQSWHREQAKAKQRLADQCVFSGEVQFGGWGDGHKSGPWVKLHLSDSDDLSAFRGLTERKSKQSGHRFMIAVAEIGDDEKIVAPQPEKPKGGPLAKLAGVWCREPAFWVFLNDHVMQGYGQEFKKVSDEAGAIEAVHYVCIVKSRAELDHNKQAAARFNEYIREPYMEYLRVHGGGK